METHTSPWQKSCGSIDSFICSGGALTRDCCCHPVEVTEEGHCDVVESDDGEVPLVDAHVVSRGRHGEVHHREEVPVVRPIEFCQAAKGKQKI